MLSFLRPVRVRVGAPYRGIKRKTHGVEIGRQPARRNKRMIRVQICL
jgi:hypothetical protein